MARQIFSSIRLHINIKKRFNKQFLQRQLLRLPLFIFYRHNKKSIAITYQNKPPAMIAIYIFLILLAAFPVILTIWRMQKAATIKKNGVHTDSVVTHISTIRTMRGGATDILTLEYKDRATGQPYIESASVTTKKL